MDAGTLPVRIVYAVNVLVAGPVGTLSHFRPPLAARKLFDGMAEAGPAVRVSGAFWLTLAALSTVGLWRPRAMALVLVIQLSYKGLWLVADAVPAVLGSPPRAMAGIFAAYVGVLPFIIPWGGVFAAG